MRLLSEEVANQIAAGEVVERPASVLKELLENALDAGAAKIAVQVEAAGRSLIRVVDDGCGMDRDDLLMCLERHATSKVSTGDDLLHVGTLGFRGEAVPSVSAVSRMTLRSRPADLEVGCLVEVSAGSIRRVEEAGCPAGTLVEVRDLFFNTPARKKFLKSQATEAAHLNQAFTRQALARPEVSFSFRTGGRVLYDLPAGNDLAVRAAALLGRDAVERMIPLKQEVGPLLMEGLAGLPSLSRKTYDQVHLFVNGRHVRDKVLLHAVGQAYLGLLPDGRRPVLVLRLEMDPGQVDVNVHPAKTEVRFRAQREIHDALMQGLRRGLAASGEKAAARAPVRAFRPAYRPAGDWGRASYASPGSGNFSPGGYAPQKERFSPDPAAGESINLPRIEPEVPAPRPPSPEARPLFTGAGSDLHVLGQLHDLYVICSSPRGLVIMDQHAAHERLAYEELKKGLGRGAMPRQGLLAPVMLELGPTEAAWAGEQAADWAGLGLEMEHFGGCTWAVRAVPPVLAGRDPGPVIRDLLSELNQSGVSASTPEFLELGLRSLACRSAIKSGQRLSRPELEDLVRRAAALPPPVTCPHGRPVFLSVSSAELARRFGRSGESSR